jgi:ATP-binding cassette subfamily F protein uup
LGKNGSGKTTFIKMLLGEVTPDSGTIKRARDLQFSYFDQKRRDLVLTDSLWKTLSPQGGEYIDVMGKQRHVCGYLKDFLFDPSTAHQPISTLSGGQKNRLLLARILANPGSFLILDEPTNDLDMETLDRLEEILSQYKGTLLVVSHDRDFLDQTVTKVLAFEGDGKIDGVIGGYSDYLALKQSEQAELIQKNDKVKTEKDIQPLPSNKVSKKLSYALNYELNNLPEKIEKLTQQKQSIEAELAQDDLYKRNPDRFHHLVKELSSVKEELDKSELRWLELDLLQSETL